MPYTLYRGDSRAPTDPTLYQIGFQARVPLTLLQARTLVQRCDGLVRPGAVSQFLPDRAYKPLKDAVESAQKYNWLDLGACIKKEKGKDTVWISMDPTQAAGGYGSQNIYRVIVPNPIFKVTRHGVATQNPANLDPGGIHPQLVLDANNVGAANVIAISIYGNAGTEVAFLTDVPYEWFDAYQQMGAGPWLPIPPP